MVRHAIPGGISLLFIGCGLSVVGFEAPGLDGGPSPEADAAAPDDAPASIADGGVDAPVDAGPPPCADASVECCGFTACPQGTTECIDGGCFVTITVAARIDGRDDLLLENRTARWQHLQHQKPTSLELNGEDWPADFKNNDLPDNRCDQCFSSTSRPLEPAVASHPQAGILVEWSGRGGVSLAPATQENGFTLKVQFDDPPNNEGNYTATVKYETR